MTTEVSNVLVRLIWDWRGSRALGTPLDQIENDYAALAAESANPHGPAERNPLVHLYLARLLLADPAAPAEQLTAAERYLESAGTTTRPQDGVLRLMITWLRAEAALRRDDP